jgi:hypothetical protein
MKSILMILTIIPFITFAQTPKTKSAKSPLIESITSDTVDGKFNQLSFSYDKRNRVISITKKEIIITTDSNKINKQVEQITDKQEFEYKGDSTVPFARKFSLYEFDDKNKEWYLDIAYVENFLFKDGKRVYDSTLYNDDEKKDSKPKNRYKQIHTSERIYSELDLSIPYNEPNGGIQYYIDEFELTSQSNVSSETSEWTIGKETNGSYYTFTKYDKMLNPLKQLNIAGALADEKISLTSNGKYSNTVISWYFLNQNNFLNLSISTDERSSPFKQIYSFRYFYNQYKQPIFAIARVKEETRKEGIFYKKYQKRYTFRYNKISNTK